MINHCNIEIYLKNYLFNLYNIYKKKGRRKIIEIRDITIKENRAIKV